MTEYLPGNESIGKVDIWDVRQYERSGEFVLGYGGDVVGFLDPQLGERILDLGCGIGHLSAEIASFGADVLGIDSSISMISRARESYPDLPFDVIDAREMNFGSEFDGVFSNAVLHWINPPSVLAAKVWRALKSDGRFVAEFGGEGNIGSIVGAIHRARKKAGARAITDNPWYFPSVGEYVTLLEKEGFTVTDARLFKRPTPFVGGADGMRNWLELFAKPLMGDLPDDQRSDVMGLVEDDLRAEIFSAGVWTGDYVRIRIRAVK